MKGVGISSLVSNFSILTSLFEARDSIEVVSGKPVKIGEFRPRLPKRSVMGLFPDKSMIPDYSTWQALLDELPLFPHAEHDDLFDALQTLMEGAVKYGGYMGGSAASSRTDRREHDWDLFDFD